MLVGNCYILYFSDFKKCFSTYEVIMDSLNDWEFPIQVNEGYGIFYSSKLNQILDIKEYEIRSIIDIKMKSYNNYSTIDNLITK